MSAAKKINPSLSPSEVIKKALEGNFHVCQSSGFMFEQEMKSSRAIYSNTERFFRQPATVALWPEEVDSRSEEKSLFLNRSFSSSLEKPLLLDEMKTLLERLIKSQTTIAELCGVADEFITNALFNAPFIDPLTNQNAKLDRSTTVVDLPRGKEARLFLAEDGQRLLIGIHDPFGSLDVRSYLERIAHCYNAGVADSINFGEGGAGIGSYIIFNAGSSLYYGVRPGINTTLVCVVPFKLSRRLREGMPKHLHWIR